MCKQIVGFTAQDMAAGLDQGNFSGKAVKTEDGTIWIPVTITPFEAALTGVTLGYKREDKVCSR